ncbi:hypothetical protein IAU59_003868 [Kwoniella sp. CBS 9459]
MDPAIAGPSASGGGGQPQSQPQQATLQPTSLAQPVPAQPPSRSEVERKLSFRSAASTRAIAESPKKKKPSHPPPPHAGGYHPTSGNDSDSSSITSSTLPPTIGSPNPTSPILTPATTSVGGLSAIAERKLGMGMGMGGDMLDEMELEDVEEEAEGEAENEGEAEGESGSEDEEGLQGLERGMEGERVVKSGYLYKKQERRKAWKKRWFVLRTGKLAYYKDEKEYSLKRVLDLHDVHTVAPVTVKKHPHSFGIVTPKRTFFAKGSSQDDMEEWVRAINGVRRRISEREEEERMKREKSEHQQHQQQQQHPRSSSIPIPQRDRSSNLGHEHIDAASPQSHSIGTNAGGSSGGYFVNRPQASSPQALHAAGAISPGLATGGVIPPSSPMDTTNSLTSQMAKMSIPTPRTPSTRSAPGHPPSSFMSSPRHINAASSVPPARAVSGPSATARREPSTSSIGSSAAAAEPYSYSQPSALTLPPGGANSSAIIASSEDEDDLEGAEGGQYESFNQQGNVNAPFTPIDPNKVILSAYLMKRSKGRGRKVWRKRWFVLTSQGVTYTKSHMDTKALRYIPLTSVLDALEVDASDPSSGSESDQPPSAHSHSHSQAHSHVPSFHPHSHPHSHLQSTSPPQKQGFHNAMRGRLSSNDTNPASSTPRKIPSSSGGHGEKHGEENTFRLITAKRTYVLCAPSEEDEIKWLAAVRALLNQSRSQDISSALASPIVPTSPTVGSGPGSNANAANTSFTVTSRIPTITQQPPTPGSLPLGSSGGGSGSGTVPEAPNMGAARSRSASRLSQSHGTTMADKDLPYVPVPPHGSTSPSVSGSASASASASASSTPTMTRGRSATYLAKSAVADVVRKFHPERVQGDV